MKYKRDVGKQIEELLINQPGLAINKESNTEFVLEGTITVNGRIKQFNLQKTYHVRLIIPKELSSLPKAYEIGEAIDKSYEHKYPNGGLCLDTDTAIKLYFANGFDLLEWFNKYVQGYFISYEFYKRFGVYPFGDRRHGFEGILDTYKEIFDVDSDNSVVRIMAHIAVKEYRGHHDCPCGSGKRIRNCHGKQMRIFYNDEERSVLIQDLSLLYKIIKESEKTNGKKR